MKKLAVTLIAVFVVLGIGSQAIAFGPGGCCKFNPHGTALTPEQITKFNKFQQDTLALRQKMLQLKTELQALMTAQNPDFKAIAEKEKQMVDLRVEIQKKAIEAGLPAYTRGMGMGRGLCGCQAGGLGPVGFKASKKAPAGGYRL